MIKPIESIILRLPSMMAHRALLRIFLNFEWRFVVSSNFPPSETANTPSTKPTGINIMLAVNTILSIPCQNALEANSSLVGWCFCLRGLFGLGFLTMGLDFIAEPAFFVKVSSIPFTWPKAMLEILRFGITYTFSSGSVQSENCISSLSCWSMWHRYILPSIVKIVSQSRNNELLDRVEAWAQKTVPREIRTVYISFIRIIFWCKTRRL